MNTMRLSNIQLDTLRAFLLEKNFHFGFVHAGHELWVREDMVRPVVLRIGFEPVPEFVIRNLLRNMGVDGGEMEAFVAQGNGDVAQKRKDRKAPALL